MDRKHRDRDIDMLVLVVGMVECSLEILTRITQHLQLTRLVPKAIHPQASHNLIQALPARHVLMEEISAVQHHVNVVLLSELHDLVERLPAVVATDVVAFVVPDMAVRCDQDTNCVRVVWIVEDCGAEMSAGVFFFWKIFCKAEESNEVNSKAWQGRKHKPGRERGIVTASWRRGCESAVAIRPQATVAEVRSNNSLLLKIDVKGN